MSKSALYKGLGVGLMSFGDGLQKQMAETARQRREESLLALKRQWQIEDRDFRIEREDSLLDRSEEQARIQAANAHADAVQLIGLRDQVDRGRTEWERELTADERAAQEKRDQESHDSTVRLRDVQAAAAEARAGGGSNSLLANVPGGMTARQREAPLRTAQDVASFVQGLAPRYFERPGGFPPSVKTFRDANPNWADRLNITPDMDLIEAEMIVMNQLQEEITEARMRQFGLMDIEEPDIEDPTVDPTEEWNAAMAAIEDGVPVEFVIQGMRQRGVPEDIIQQFKSGF